MVYIKAVLFSVLIFHCVYPYGIYKNGVYSQSSELVETTHLEGPLDWWGNPSGYMNQQSHHSLNIVRKLLDRSPPVLTRISDLSGVSDREIAMVLLDNILHAEKAASYPSVQFFYHEQINKIIHEMKAISAEGTPKTHIWKTYNHGFIVKNNETTFAFDLVRGASVKEENYTLPSEIMKDLVNEIDILFVSHAHEDHADSEVASTFIAQGKPVIAPSEIWKDETFYKSVTHAERIHNKTHKVVLSKGKELSFINFPGHQGSKVINNVYLVKSNEISFMHTGDQNNGKDFETWIDHVADSNSVDVFFVNCWPRGLPRMLKKVAPKVVITGHENELGHKIDHREANWLTYVRLRELLTPFVHMTWGEHFHYQHEEDDKLLGLVRE